MNYCIRVLFSLYRRVNVSDTINGWITYNQINRSAVAFQLHSNIPVLRVAINLLVTFYSKIIVIFQPERRLQNEYTKMVS